MNVYKCYPINDAGEGKISGICLIAANTKKEALSFLRKSRIKKQYYVSSKDDEYEYPVTEPVLLKWVSYDMEKAKILEYPFSCW